MLKAVDVVNIRECASLSDLFSTESSSQKLIVPIPNTGSSGRCNCLTVSKQHLTCYLREKVLDAAPRLQIYKQFFRQMPASQSYFSRFFHHFQRQRWTLGNAIFKEGQKSDESLFLVVSGEVRLSFNRRSAFASEQFQASEQSKLEREALSPAYGLSDRNYPKYVNKTHSLEVVKRGSFFGLECWGTDASDEWITTAKSLSEFTVTYKISKHLILSTFSGQLRAGSSLCMESALGNKLSWLRQKMQVIDHPKRDSLSNLRFAPPKRLAEMKKKYTLHNIDKQR